MYHYFGELLRHFENNRVVLAKVQKRWDFIWQDIHGLAYILTPKYASAGNFFSDKALIMSSINNYAECRNPGEAQQAEDEMIRYVQHVSNLSGPKKDMVHNMSASQYWDILGKDEFPFLYKCAKPINAMVASSASSERAWSIFGFIHTPLRNRLANDKVDKIVFLYINAGFMDSKDKTDYIIEDMIQSISWEEFDD